MPRKAKSPKTEVTEEVKASTVESTESPFVRLLKQLQAGLSNNSFGLTVTPNKGFGRGPMIQILGNSGTHCFARVSALPNNGFQSEFLSSVPSQIHAYLTEVFKVNKINNSGKNFLHPSGIL